MNRCAGAALIGAAMLAAVAARPGQAMESCTGTYSATLLRPLPVPLVVGVAPRDNSPRNLDLVGQFRAGLEKAGVAVTGTPTAQLTLNVTRSSGGFRDDAPEPAPEAGFGWMGGGVDRQLPDESRFGGSRQAAGPVTVLLRAELRRTPTDPVAWVATLQCNMQGNDDRLLSFEIGTLIGGAIGRRVDQARF